MIEDLFGLSDVRQTGDLCTPVLVDNTQGQVRSGHLPPDGNINKSKHHLKGLSALSPLRSA